MFRGLFGPKSDRPAPPKNQIELICPACGAAQYEPRLVVSTFCKKCGVHLTVDRKRVTASSVTRSGFRRDTPEVEPPRKLEPQKKAPATPAAATPPAPDPEKIRPAASEEVAEGGFGAFLKQHSATAAPDPAPPIDQAAEPPPPQAPKETPPEVEAPAAPAQSAPETAPSPSPLARLVQGAAADPAPPAPASTAAPKTAPAPDLPADLFAAPEVPPTAVNQPPLERRPQSNSPPPTAAPAPMSASTLQKMKDQGLYRNQYFKDAQCFECPHKFKVSRSSRSATCPECGAQIAMEDIEINMASTQEIKTRGDLLIRKRGHLVTERIICKDLRCYGTLEADVEASGDAIFRSTGTVVGNVRCKRLIIEKGCDVLFQSPVHAEEVEVHARVTGSLISSGMVLIGANGSANGDVTARSVSIEPGGELNGAMNIVRATKPKSKPAAAEAPLEPAPSEDGS